MSSRRQLTAWVAWILILAAVTTILLWSRGDVDQAHVSLTMLLVVLGGSIAGGRALGFTLSAVCIALINFYFQSPYGLFSVGKPFDWVILLNFFVTSFVTTELLTRARQEADAAEARANEVEALSRLGAESLQYATAEEALEAIADRVRRAMGADHCTIVPRELPRSLRGRSPADAPSPQTSEFEQQASALAVDSGRPVLLREDNTLAEHSSADIAKPPTLVIRARFLALPLRAEERIIGVLVVRGNEALVLDAPRRRLLAALGYYAALAIERMRLMAEAAQAESLRQVQRAKDQIFASVSHDLRTPLTTIKVLAQTGASRGEPSSIAIAEQADRLARMVGDLLELSRLRTGTFSLSPELNTADDLAGAALRQAEGILNGRHIDVQIDFDSPALVGRFDFVHTLRIVGNLLDNALRHTPEGGTVELRAERDEGWLVITVADRGTGVAADEQSRIFESFYRPADATPDAGHAGLGLSIARSLADLQGGTVAYRAREGGGSIFELRLPAADVDDMAVDV
jgi:two-component system sensor histidine kinase KdpD